MDFHRSLTTFTSKLGIHEREVVTWVFSRQLLIKRKVTRKILCVYTYVNVY